MNWEALGAIAEFVGAAGVIASLVYLGVQIRGQNRESRLAAMHEVNVSYRESIAVVLDPELADLFVRANEDPDSLSDVESLRLIILLITMFRLWEEAHYLWTEGRLDARIWDSMASQYSTFLSTASFKRVWALRHQHFSPAFQDFVNGQEAMDYQLQPKTSTNQTDTE